MASVRRSARLAGELPDEITSDPPIVHTHSRRPRISVSAMPPKASTCSPWQIDSILDARKDQKTGEIQYLIRWTDFPPWANSWQNESDLGHIMVKIYTFKFTAKGLHAMEKIQAQDEAQAQAQAQVQDQGDN